MARKRNELVQEANADIAASIDFNNEEDFTVLEDKIDDENESEDGAETETRPKMDSPEWTNWVLSQFEQSELDEGRPKVDGLRRMVRKLIGPIIKGKAEVKQVPTVENEQRSTVEYTIVVLNRYSLEKFETEYELEYTDAADAYWRNINGLQFGRFPVAMASTRAEVRALRKALNFGIAGSEELSDQPLEEAGFSGKISESQITKIDIKCQQLNIDVIKFINMGKIKYSRIEDVTNHVAIKMFGLINEYQQTVKPIPDSIVGYKPNWRGEF